MTRTPYQHPMDEPGIDTSPRVSALAVSSLVFGLLCCIPVSGLIGTILGGAGLVRISKSDGRLSGRGMAFTGLILGLLGTMFWLAAGAGTIWFFKEAQKFVQPVQSIAAGDFDAARKRLSTATAAKLTDERAKEFTQEIKDELGAPKGTPKGAGQWLSDYMEVGQLIQGAQASAPSDVAPFPVPVRFERDVAMVMVYIEKGSSSGGLPPIRNISIHTKGGKVLWMIPPNSGP